MLGCLVEHDGIEWGVLDPEVAAIHGDFRVTTGNDHRRTGLPLTHHDSARKVQIETAVDRPERGIQVDLVSPIPRG
ncbi:MAG: hypothetical protein NVS3B27_07010 [Novosphingobium sp.]